MANRKIFISLSFCMLAILATAQISIPQIDFQVKSGVGALMDVKDSYENLYSYSAPILSGEINWNITQHISLGAFSSIGPYAKSNFKMENYGNSGKSSYGATHFLYGAKLRLSTGRAPRFRPFTEISFGKLEMQLEKDIYRLASSTTFIGLSFGLMIRAGSRLYIILPQANIRFRSNGFFFEAPNEYLFNAKYSEFIELCAGVSYNIGKKK
jgi:hypothetical protein